MLSKQIWLPDTCGCQIEQTFDYSTDPATLVSVKVIKLGAEHSGTDDEVHTKVQDENRRKNKILDRAQTQFPSQFDSNGKFLGSWSFDSNRVLTVVTAPGLTPTQKSNIQTWCDTNLGVGKVIIQ